MITKKEYSISLYYELHEILGDKALLICLNDHIPYKNIRVIVKDITNLTLTSYLEVFEYLLALPYRNLRQYKTISNLDFTNYFDALDMAITGNYALPINLNNQLKTLEIMIKRVRIG